MLNRRILDGGGVVCWYGGTRALASDRVREGGGYGGGGDAVSGVLIVLIVAGGDLWVCCLCSRWTLPRKKKKSRSVSTAQAIQR